MEIKKIVDVHKENGTVKIIKIQILLDREYSNSTMFGVDPGTVHLGLASIWKNNANIFEITMPRRTTAIDRLHSICKLMDECFGVFDADSLGVIEGASYGDRYRQVELAEIRMAATVWFERYSIYSIVVPPTTIRKQVMGGGKIKPETVWTELPSNAANALACAMYRP